MRPPRSLPPPRRRQGTPIGVGQEEAFTMVELLVGASMTVLVVGSLAAIALISELRMGRDAEVNQALRNNWSRATSFIANEAHQANWMRTTMPANTAYPCAGGLPASPLVLEGPTDPANPPNPRWRVVYGVRANGTTGTDWKGFNRLVRCGPPFETLARSNSPDPVQQREAALSGNLNVLGAPVETVIADQLAQTNPFVVELFDTASDKDRHARLSLFLSRRAGASYPPANSFTTYQTHIRANRNPGFDLNGNPNCITITTSGFEEPPAGAVCQPIQTTDAMRRRSIIKEFNLPASGTFNVAGTPEALDVVYLKGKQADFTTRLFNNTSTAPCSRISCYISNGRQTATIQFGNVLVFSDAIERL